MTLPDDLLIDAPALAALLRSGAAPTLLDVRWRLAGPPGHDDYLAGHAPGAVFVDLDTSLCGPPGEQGRHPLPAPAALQDVLRAAGVSGSRPVVVYDDGDQWAAARTWWTLRWAGHPDVRVLDGGFRAWRSGGFEVTSEEPAVDAGDFTVRPGGLPVLDAAGAATVAAGGVLIDARAPERYRGEVEPVDAAAGHIPGAVNVPTAGNTGADGRFLAPGRLRDRFAAAGVTADAGAVGAYCGSGVTAAHTVLALHLAGRPDAALYVGSWSEWITDSARPRATGAE
ncbi:sulfurtransferase [Catenuloplanes atrovinosus]|uniref:Thiosulfate/3-mercaptopyruvate sulfurtransferase n=1 Tax=Catenuloplanes atrovinosus TaxID=137266 RepID=A0AAE3YJD9_9ACTN|nr:sulfurtransferase [Catenuloplanes atrovinosus]MDR7273475.1 thiosulfate/3-mercaptopyruvate sulfurtransferase [Catenuloplanes atrovinosus]